MVLTFTGSFRALGVDHDDVKRMLVAALGCNLAWGIIDAVMYLMGTLSQRGHNLMLLRSIQTASPEEGRRFILDAMSDDVAKLLTDAEIESLRLRFLQLPRGRAHLRLHSDDLKAAAGVFLLVFLSTLPVVLPFVFMVHPTRSLRVSNLIAVIMLFLSGMAYGKFAGGRPWRVGALMVVVGACNGGPHDCTGRMTVGRRFLPAAFLLIVACAYGQAPSKPQPHSPVVQANTPDKEPWEYSLTVDGYVIEGEDGFAQPTFTADHNWLHLEARYNYENLRTGSLWAGYNFSWGKTWQFELTPMIGGVFGRTNGIAPGCEASLSWKKLTLSIDNEYVFDTTSKSGNFYYAWPQLTIAPVDWFHFGGVAQRTKAFQAEIDVQRGFFVGFHKKVGPDHKQKVEFTTYIFDPGSDSTTVTLEVGWSF